MTQKHIVVYLVSDSTGETVTSVARSATAHFEHTRFEESLWSFVLTEGKLEKFKAELLQKPGIVFYTFANADLQYKMEEICSELGVLCIPVLSNIVKKISEFLNEKSVAKVGLQHKMNEDYFAKLQAVEFAMSHDDGISVHEMNQADIILVGVSRTSKSPTCLYLAYKGYKTANVPYVQGNNFVELLSKYKKPLIVGLTIQSEILLEIRRNRVTQYNVNDEIQYIDNSCIRDELKEARKLFNANNWPIIDVSRRSVEETAALILQLYEKKRIAEK
jgi:[pyruvate, water dikinase]-phosphate phosphotransferase / [pyruvate, water dikinase] kinase